MLIFVLSHCYTGLYNPPLVKQHNNPGRLSLYPRAATFHTIFCFFSFPPPSSCPSQISLQTAASPWTSWASQSLWQGTLFHLPTHSQDVRYPVCHQLQNPFLTYRHPTRSPRLWPANAHRAPSPPVALNLVSGILPAVYMCLTAKRLGLTLIQSSSALTGGEPRMAGYLLEQLLRRLSTLW